MNPIASKYQIYINPILLLKEEIAELEIEIYQIRKQMDGRIKLPYQNKIDSKQSTIKKLRGKIEKLKILDNDSLIK